MNRTVYFMLYLFQLDQTTNEVTNVKGACAGLGQYEDARVLQKHLRETYTGLEFPVYEDSSFDDNGYLIMGARPVKLND